MSVLRHFYYSLKFSLFVDINVDVDTGSWIVKINHIGTDAHRGKGLSQQDWTWLNINSTQDDEG